MPQSEGTKTAAPPERREVDLVRFDVEQTESGLYVHKKTKFVFELSRPDAR